MKRLVESERILIEDIAQIALKAKVALKGLSIGELIRLIRTQLGMSQKILAKRAKVPQSTISRTELGKFEITFSTMEKILNALFCDLIVVPVLRESIDSIRKKQARKKAEERVRYLKGTMSLEDQTPDARFLENLIHREENKILHEAKLWEE
jgi:transcriptional regulator with XRE-family HTH domain